MLPLLINILSAQRQVYIRFLHSLSGMCYRKAAAKRILTNKKDALNNTIIIIASSDIVVS